MDVEQWAVEKLDDPELREVARSVLDLVYLEGLARQLAREDPSSRRFWEVVAAIRTFFRNNP